MQVIGLRSKLRDYEVYFPDSDGFTASFQQYENRIFVVDSNVWRIYAGSSLRNIPEKDVIIFTVSEEKKCLKSVEELCEKFMERSAKKNMTLISIGGGIIQDITGYAACTLYRGINWVFVPTTLLAQADSCIGSKTSLNFKGYKNLIGTFYPPSKVFIHTPFLSSLEHKDLLSGLGEVAKLHIMGGDKMTSELIDKLPFLLDGDCRLLKEAVLNSLQVKKEYMEGDEFDVGRRNLLNYGHCFGHALESVSNYSVPHGQAVVIGMIFANMVSECRGLLSAEKNNELTRRLLGKLLNIPVDPAIMGFEKILQAMKQDKKRVGEGLVIVLMKDDGTFEKVADFSEKELSDCLERVAPLLNNISSGVVRSSA